MGGTSNQSGPPTKTGQSITSPLLPDDPPLVFNGIQASDSSYRIPPLRIAEFAAATRQVHRPTRKALPRYISNHDLAHAGWGVVFAGPRADQHREALTPLLRLRQQQAGELFRDDLVCHPSFGLIEFLKENGGNLAEVDPHKLPYHLLLVGELEEISFELQAELSLSYAVGRLSFETPQEFANYAASVVAAEAGESRPGRRLELFATRNWDDDNTAWSERYLVEPLATTLRKYRGFELSETQREATTKRRLTQLLGDDAPSLLFASCHGVNFWPQDPLQPSDQGALLCYDWPGPIRNQGQKVSPDHYVAARDVASDADLRGMVAFLFSCYGIGTPQRDAFDRGSGHQIRQIARHDQLSSLPRRLLGIPKGALAVLGHIDQAWCHSYYWGDLGSQTGHFESAIKLMLHGETVGSALEPFSRRLGTVDYLVIREQERLRKAGLPQLSDDERQAMLWTAHYDAFYYVLLGDPAVRLPAALRDAPEAEGEVES